MSTQSPKAYVPRAGSLNEQIYHLMRANPNRSYNQNAVAHALGLRRSKLPAVHVALANLSSRGLVTARNYGDGHGWMHRLASPPDSVDPAPTPATAPAPTPAIRATATRLHALGFNVNLLGNDKNPIHYWKNDKVDYTVNPQTDVQFADLPWEGYTRRDGTLVAPPVGNAIISGINDVRTLDLDKCTDPEILARVIDAMGLPADYGWQYRSGSHRGYGVVVVCPDTIPASLLDRFAGTTEQILVGTPRDGAAFKQLELRYSGCQTVVPPSLHPSGNTYEWLYGEPTPPPATVTIDQLLAGFLAIAELPPPAPPKVEPKPAVKTNKLFDPTSDATRIIQRVNEETCRDYLGAKPAKNAACPCPAGHDGGAEISFGNTVCFCHSNRPGCLLAGVKGLDRWKLEVILEYGGDNRACLIAHGWQPPAPTIKTERDGPTPAQIEAHRKDAERKKRERQQVAAELRADVMGRAAADDTLTKAEHAVLSTLLTIAGDRGWCRPSKERIAEMGPTV